MAIERYNDASGAVDESSAVGATEKEAAETATVPMSILNGQEVAEGDVVRLRVVSVDEENQTVELAYASSPAKSRNAPLDEMAGKFDEPMKG